MHLKMLYSTYTIRVFIVMELWENELIVEEHELLQTGATSCLSVAEATELSFRPLLFDQELIESPRMLMMVLDSLSPRSRRKSWK
jgi:hypothetical protein